LPLLREANKPFNFVLTRVRANLRNNNSAAMALDALGLVLPVRMHERVIYAETFAHGKTAIDIDPPSPAGQEIASLWQSVKGLIG
jgi:chromosome partitioning protein